jgi:hypothetical protein
VDGTKKVYLTGSVTPQNLCGLASPDTVFLTPTVLPLPVSSISQVEISDLHISVVSTAGAMWTCVWDSELTASVVGRPASSPPSISTWYTFPTSNVVKVKHGNFATFFQNCTVFPPTNQRSQCRWFALGDNLQGNLAIGETEGLPELSPVPLVVIPNRNITDVIPGRTLATTWVAYGVVVDAASNSYAKATSLSVTGLGFQRPLGEFSTILATIHNSYQNASSTCGSSSQVISNTQFSCILSEVIPFYGDVFISGSVDGEVFGPVRLGVSVPEAEITASSTSLPARAQSLSIFGRFPAVDTSLDVLVEFSDLNLVCNVISSSTVQIVCALSTRVPSPIRSGLLRAQVSFFGGLPSEPAVVADVTPEPSVATNENELPSTASMLVIRGSNFGTNQSQIDLLTLGISCASFNLTSDSTIECNLSELVDVRGPVKAAVARRIGGQSEIESTSVIFSVVATIVGPPRVRTPDSPSLYSSSVATISLAGSNFGSNASQLAVTLVVTSNKRASTTVPCTNVALSSGVLTCSPSSTLPSGQLSIGVSRIGAPGPFIPVGTVLASASVADTSSSQVLASSAVQVFINGSAFTYNGTSGVGSVILLAESAPSIPIACNIQGPILDGFLRCVIPSVEAPRITGKLLANVTVFGGRVPATAVASIVENPSVISSDANKKDVGTAGPFTITGRSFGSNGVLAPDFKATVDLNLQKAQPCVVDGTGTRYDTAAQIWTVVCSTNGLNISAPGAVLASVYANGADSGAGQKIAEFVSVGGSKVVYEPPSGGVIAAIVVAIVAFCLLMIYPLILIRRYYKQWQDDQKFRKQIPSEMRSMFNISTGELKMFNKLGEGSFGAVFRGMYKGRFVAIKKLANSMLSDQVASFFAEASLMLSIKPHINIVRTYGMCQEAHNLSMVMELIPNGSLDKLLERDEISSEKQMDDVLFFKLARGIAVGMRQLSSQGVVHRDVRAFSQTHCSNCSNLTISSLLLVGHKKRTVRRWERTQSCRVRLLTVPSLNHISPMYLFLASECRA